MAVRRTTGGCRSLSAEAPEEYLLSCWTRRQNVGFDSRSCYNHQLPVDDCDDAGDVDAWIFLSRHVFGVLWRVGLITVRPTLTAVVVSDHEIVHVLTLTDLPRAAIIESCELLASARRLLFAAEARL